MEYLSCLYCGHANESGWNCDCPENCYCKAPGNTCDPNKNKNSNHSKKFEKLDLREKKEKIVSDLYEEYQKDLNDHLIWHSSGETMYFRKLSSIEDFVLLKNKVKQISLRELNSLYQNFDSKDVILTLNYNNFIQNNDLVISRPETNEEFIKRVKQYVENMEGKKEKEIKNMKNQIKELEEQIKKIENE